MSSGYKSDNMWAISVVIFSAFVLQTLARPQLYEDDSCRLRSGEMGVCRRISKCPSAKQQLRSRSVRPEHCGFIKSEVVVCCVEERRRPSDEACEAYRSKDPNQLIPKIIGGEIAQEGEFPHMASLGYVVPGESQVSFRCGGSLISDEFVLTAAHCVSNRNLGLPKVVRLGVVDIAQLSEDGQDFPIDSDAIIRHPRYSRRTYYDDIALIRLPTRLMFTRFIYPACLYTKQDTPKQMLVATGWGATERSGALPSRFLLKANLTAVSLNECSRMVKSVERSKLPDGLRDNMLCAEEARGRADTCVGDSGGPLQLLENPDDSLYSVAGVTSFGPSPCGGKSMYSRVASYLDWIESVVWP